MGPNGITVGKVVPARGKGPAEPQKSLGQLMVDRATATDPENLADAIQKISVSMTRLLKTGLNRDAIITLIKDDTGLGKREIATVLTSLQTLAKRYANG
jgi:hypothetical protein